MGQRVQGVRDLLTLARCGRFAAGFPATVAFAHRTLGDLSGAYDLVVTPAVESAITDPAERAGVNAALRAMSMKMGMAMLSYARLAGCEQPFEVAALAGAVTRLYDDLIDGSADGSIDDRLGCLFSARPFIAASELERLLADLVAGIRKRVEPIGAAEIALGSLHEYQSLSRRQREPGVPPAVLEKICRGKGAMANLTLCSLVNPGMEAGERELIMAFGEAFQSLDDYIDVHLDAHNGVTTLVSLGVTTLADIGLRLRELRPALAACYGRAATRRYCGMIYFLLLTAAVDRRLPALGRILRRLMGPSTLKVFVIKGTDALPAAPGVHSQGEAGPCDG
jgi:hypothetical protein